MKNVEEAVIYSTPRKKVDKIRNLLSLREKLVVTKASLLRNIKELKSFDKEIAKLSEKLQKNSVKGIILDLKKLKVNWMK